MREADGASRRPAGARIQASRRREKLRGVLVDLAERRIATSGYRSLTARDMASEAGCAVGAIYNLFDDMDALAEAANARTAGRLEAAVGRALAAQPGGDPKRQLMLLARTYLDFVLENPLAWAAIFELAGKGGAFAERRVDENARLVAHIIGPLRRLLPEMEQDAVARVARALFAAVHGIVSLGYQQRFLSSEPEHIATQLDFIVGAFCDGADGRGRSPATTYQRTIEG